MTQRLVSGTALLTLSNDEKILAAWFPKPELGDAAVQSDVAEQLATLTGEDPGRGIRTEITSLTIDLDAPAASTADAYLRLHALSHLLVKPNELNLDGIFGLLPIVAWSNAGAIDPDFAADNTAALLAAGISIKSLDKFPPLLDFVTPKGVRIGDASRVRLGAYLAPGTTVMHEGFVNFNAGTLGVSMVEGRISQGVVVGNGSDIGGGASIMGTLSGGGAHRVSIGERSLLGANAGIGISLGNDCVVEAGLYVTAGSKIVLADQAVRADGSRPSVKGAELSGKDGILFRRNSLSGAIEAVARKGVGVTLNEALHA